MSLIRKKKIGVDNKAEIQSAGEFKNYSPKHVAKRKSKDTMAGLIAESVPESALEIMRENVEFIADKDGEDVYVGMLLDTQDIGGLTKKQANKNEDKGTIVELINSGSIAAYVPERLLEDEKMVIIPSAGTLVAMDEFPLLTEAKYSIAIVTDDSEVEELDVPITFHEAFEVANGDANIMDVLASHGIEWAEAGEESDDYEEDDETMQTEEIMQSDDDFMPDDDEDIEYDGVDSEGVFQDEIPSADIIGDESEDEYTEAEIDESEESEEELPGEEAEEFEEEFIDENAIAKAVKFRFYSDELGLEVNGDPFDAQFMVENPYVPFNENRGEGWLNQYLNEMSIDANMAMKRLHREHLLRLREKYYSLLSLHCEQIQRDLDPNNPETIYGEMNESIEENYMKQHQTVADIVGRKRDEIKNNWNKMLEQVGEDAALSAQQQYRDRYGRQHSDELQRVETDVINQIEAKRQSDRRDMNVIRREEAARRLDYGIIETLKKLSDEYRQLLDIETEQYQGYRNRIAEFLDEHRKDDIAHDKALAEELAQSQKADVVLREYTAKLEAARESYEQSRNVMKADIEHIQRENEERLRDKKLECDNRVAEMSARLKEQERKYDDLLAKFAQLDEAKAAEFHCRLSEAQDQKAAWQSRCDDIVAAHKRGNIVVVALCFAIAIASACVGVFAGTQLNLKFGSDKVTTHMNQEFDRRMDEIEKNHKDDASKNTKQENKAEDKTGNSVNTQSGSEKHD